MCSPELSDLEIYKIIYWVIGRKRFPESIAVEDLVQEGWEAALIAKKTYRSDKGAKLSSWIVTSVSSHLSNFISDEIKRIGKFKQVETLDIEAKRKEVQEGVLLSILKKVLSPLAFCLLVIRIRTYPLKVKKEDIIQSLNVSSTEVDMILVELRWSIRVVRQYLN